MTKGGILILLGALAARAAAQDCDNVVPFAGDRAGGTYVVFPNATYSAYDGVPPNPFYGAGVAFFGRVQQTYGGYELYYYDQNDSGLAVYRMEATTPASDVSGIVDVELQHTNGPTVEYPGCFTFVDAPILESVSPTNHSIGEDNRRLKIHGVGFPILRTVEVWVGGVMATDVQVAPHADGQPSGTLVTCVPPPFPGGEWPLTVDVKVVTVGGGETTLESAYTYQQVVPVAGIQPVRIESWTHGRDITMGFRDYLCVGGISVFLDGRQLECIELDCDSPTHMGCLLPPYSPGVATIAIVNPDGGMYERDITFYRTNRFHKADLNQDGMLKLPEVLRIVQFYNSGGYFCNSGANDGYGAGPEGDTSCIPHDADLQTQDWRIDLHEILEVIQIFNFRSYTLCENRYTFCMQETAASI